MNVDLRYFSGTGNSYKIINVCKKIFVQNGCKVTLSSVIKKASINKDADLIGFCFPVYAFGIPRICRKYLLDLPKFERPINAFVLITAGEPDESGFAVMETNKILKKKGINVTYTKVIQMPANWTVSMNPPSKEEARLIIESGIIKAKKTAHEILDGTLQYHTFNYPPKYSKFVFFKDYYLFKWLGLSNLWRDFRTDETCDSCGLCEKVCPTDSIRIVNNKPNWSKTCEQCMRCVNYCPKQAIFQKAEGSIKGKNTYYEPSFRPLKNK
ncbi:MAG: EFR1 family ferrodoxin [Desulfobacterales bacterium]|nr:EFR1 family ferrodoxin [Desulfobacterales bacterium]